MKFNFRKIASVLASTVMLSSTVAMAAATTLPAPFVQSGKADVAIVYGSSPLAAATDMAAATDIQAYLDGKVSSQMVPGSSNSQATVTGGDSVTLYKDNNRINIGENLNAVYTTLDEDELSTVLASGTYEDEPGNNYDYKQKITLGNPQLTHFADDIDGTNPTEIPVVGFDLASGSNVMNYTLDFTDNPSNNSATMETTTIDMLGREYYISDVDASGANLKLTLLDTANTATVTEGETTTVTIGGATYEVGIVGVEDANTAVLSVNGEKVSSMDEGQSRKIAPDTYLSLKDVVYNSKDSGVSSVEFSIGSGQIVLQNGVRVKINDDPIQDLTTYINTTSGKLNTIDFVWTTNEEEFLVPGKELTMPGFGTIKLSMAGFVLSDPETLSLQTSSDNYIEVKGLEVVDGSVSSFPLIYTNGSATAFAGLGKDSTHRLLTAETTGNTLSLNDAQHPKFVVTYQSGDSSESHVFELTSIDAVDYDSSGNVIKNETILHNIAANKDYTLTNDDDVDVGELNLAVTSVNGAAGTATLTVTHSGSATNVFLDRVVTAKGLTFQLPVANSTFTGSNNPLGHIGVNGTTNDTSWVMNFTEADKDSDNIGMNSGGVSFSATFNFGASNGKVEVGAMSAYPQLALDEDSDDHEAYTNSSVISGSHSTKLTLKNDDPDTLDIVYHGGEAYADVLVAEASAVIGEGSSESGVMLLKDSDVTASTNSNLIVVGGSCINSVAAELLGASYPTCGAGWESTTQVGAGSFLIQSFTRNGKVATLVAGYDAGDTTKAAKAFTTQTVDTTAGKKYTGTVETAITSTI